MATAAAAAALLAGCANQPQPQATASTYVPGHYDPRLGVYASPRVVADGEPVPRGGGTYLTGRPYTVAGRQYVPRGDASGYSATGTASWYGDAFHGRRTANGEIFDKGSISAAHPTLPLPSYVRVTNLGNGRSMIVRVNDRGPYHGGRVMDVSQRVADELDFRRAGTARIKVDYVGRAGLAGDDEERLAGTLRTDGQLAQLDGFRREVAEAAPAGPPVAVADATAGQVAAAEAVAGRPRRRGRPAPLPPARPFDADGLQALINDPRPAPPRSGAAGNLTAGN